MKPAFQCRLRWMLTIGSFPFRSITTTPRRQPQAQVHVLGLGSIGAFTAHSLAELPSPPSIKLLLHRPSLLEDYRSNGSQITLRTREGDIVNRSGFDFEILHDSTSWHSPASNHDREQAGIAIGSPANDTIEHLILCVKGTQTVDALRPLRHRLNQHSTILFLQNGSGMMDEASEKLFADPKTQPNYLMGVISHGVGLNTPFNITHTGFAATSLGPVPRSPHQYNNNNNNNNNTADNNANYLLQNLPLVPRFNAKSYSFTDVLQIQLEKLAVNAFSNPICGLNDSVTGTLSAIPETRRALTSEISRVVQALPELQAVPGIRERFSAQRLDETVNAIITMNAKSTVSMLWDLRAGRDTEIQFINGYWSRRGRELGIPTPINDSLVQQIVEKTKRIKQERGS
ncbi:2-dehydropantoate 2-reductase [Blastomyces silverae]|uniref:2-dehydropantoate 2-reductase n=1 Tax=Blastomyces silverae TaxID=2060906 RepID=A0A0H1BJK6_9EURO|nr:2-dehydropantoate 2-reductase [Blastomyces silverae]